MKSALFLLLIAASARAQVGAASLSGTVTDQSSAAVSGATVAISQPATAYTRKTVTDRNGYYAFDPAPPGSYVLTVEKAGFTPYKAAGVSLELNQNARHDARLTVGAGQEQITVSASVSPVETAGASTGYRLDNSKIQQLPLGSRNVISL